MEVRTGVRSRYAGSPQGRDQAGQRIVICDDLLATGGTAKATAEMAKSLGADICGLGFVVELDALKGRDKLKGYDVFSLLHY